MGADKRPGQPAAGAVPPPRSAARPGHRSLSPVWAAIFTLTLAALPKLALAYDWSVTAHVTRVEGSYVPAYVNIQVDQAAGTCSVGTWLFYSGNASSNNLTANVQAVYAGLLMSLEAGSTIEVFGNNSGCEIVYVHFLSN